MTLYGLYYGRSSNLLGWTVRSRMMSLPSLMSFHKKNQMWDQDNRSHQSEMDKSDVEAWNQKGKKVNKAHYSIIAKCLTEGLPWHLAMNYWKSWIAISTQRSFINEKLFWLLQPLFSYAFFVRFSTLRMMKRANKAAAAFHSRDVIEQGWRRIDSVRLLHCCAEIYVLCFRCNILDTIQFGALDAL